MRSLVLISMMTLVEITLCFAAGSGDNVDIMPPCVNLRETLFSLIEGDKVRVCVTISQMAEGVRVQLSPPRLSIPTGTCILISYMYSV